MRRSYSMKVAVPVFNGFVSPRIDCTRSMAVFEISDGTVRGGEELHIPLIPPFQLPGYLHSEGIDTLICGGIPLPLLEMMQRSGMTVYHGIIGEVSEVVGALANGGLQVDANFCFRRRCGRGRRHRGGREVF
jgi:predicted Fe-Mo cluster-binding NifX family protein